MPETFWEIQNINWSLLGGVIELSYFKRLSNVISYICNSRIMVMPSYNEPILSFFPNSSIELKCL